MIAFIDDQHIVYGVEPICPRHGHSDQWRSHGSILPIAPSTYYHRLACLADLSKASGRHQRDTELCPLIQRVWNENYQVYGVRKAWHQLKREGFDLARCPVERLMKQIGIRGAVRGKVVKTTVPDTSAPCPRDKVNRVFRAPAPNLLWVSDFTYVSTWQALSMWPLAIVLGPCMDGPLARALFRFGIPVGRGHVYGVHLQHHNCAP
jgi:putative transposase